MPLFLSANKTRDLAFVKEKTEARIRGWKGKCLSWMGRATLIKSVAQATPIYGMSIYKFPKGLCENLDGMVRRFWWNPRSDGNKFFTPLECQNFVNLSPRVVWVSVPLKASMKR